MTQYALKLPGAVYGGENALERIEALVKGHEKVVVLTDRGVLAAGLAEPLLDHIGQAGTQVGLIDNVPAEPSADQAEEIAVRCRKENGTMIVGLGGGSVLDTAKLASVLAAGGVTVRDLLRDPGLARKAVPTVLIPTTAGTGSEATPNAIVLVPEQALKVGIVSDAMVPDAVIHDGALLNNLPRPIAASTGIDALAHAIECYTSNKANPYSDTFAMEALALIMENIERACDGDPAAKSAMLTASFYAGVAITASGTTAVHALSYPLGGKYHIAHGVSNAMLLVPVIRFNRDACTGRLAAAYDRVRPGGEAQSAEEKADWVIDRIDAIVRSLQIPTDLTAFGVCREDIDGLVDAGLQVTRLLNNNPKPVTRGDARMLYEQLFHSVPKPAADSRKGFINNKPI